MKSYRVRFMARLDLCLRVQAGSATEAEFLGRQRAKEMFTNLERRVKVFQVGDEMLVESPVRIQSMETNRERDQRRAKQRIAKRKQERDLRALRPGAQQLN